MPSSSYLPSKMKSFIVKFICTLCLSLSGITAVGAIAATPEPHALSVRYPEAYVRFIPAAEKQKPHWLVISPEQGILLLDENLQPRTTLNVKAELLDSRANAASSDMVFATIIESGHVPTLFCNATFPTICMSICWMNAV